MKLKAKQGGNLEKKALGGFMSGVFILSLSTFLVKIIGLAYKIPMLSLLGAEGMGYFNSAYEIYALLCVITTAGLPIALSMMVSVSSQKDIFLRQKEYTEARLFCLYCLELSVGLFWVCLLRG
jgi:stage V sporulation protein B